LPGLDFGTWELGLMLLSVPRNSQFADGIDNLFCYLHLLLEPLREMGSLQIHIFLLLQ